MNKKQLEDITSGYLNACEQSWSVLRTGNFDVPLENVYFMLEATQNTRKPERKNDDIPQSPERREHITGERSDAAGNSKEQEKFSVEKYDQQISPIASSPLSTVLSDSRQIVLLGEPGSGKSTSLQFIGLCYANRTRVVEQLKLTEKNIPVLIRLKRYEHDLAKTNFTLTNALQSEIMLVLQNAVNLDVTELLDYWQKTYGLIVLLDGLDEISESNRQAIVSHINSFAVSPFGKTVRVIVSSRIAGYAPVGYEFKEYVIKPFESRDDLTPYVAGWLKSLCKAAGRDDISDDAEKLLLDIRRQNGLRRVLDNPLLLRLAVELYLDNRGIARNRSDLYRHSIQESLQRAKKRNHKITISEEELDQYLSKLAWTLQNSQEIPSDIPVEQLRYDLGILVEYDGKLAFSHLTFQEYFCAKYLAQSWKKNKKRTWKFLKSLIYISKWQEVLLLFLTQITDPEDTEFFLTKTLRISWLHELLDARGLDIALRLLDEDVQIKEGFQKKLIKKTKYNIEHSIIAKSEKWVMALMLFSLALLALPVDFWIRVFASLSWAAILWLFYCNKIPLLSPLFFRKFFDRYGKDAVLKKYLDLLGKLPSSHGIQSLIFYANGSKNLPVGLSWLAQECVGNLRTPALLPILISNVQSNKKDTYYSCLKAIGNIKTPESEKFIINCWNSDPYYSINKSGLTDTFIRVLGKKALPYLVALLENKEEGYDFFSKEAIVGLCGLRLPETKPLLQTYISQSNPFDLYMSDIVECFEFIGDSSDIPLLAELLSKGYAQFINPEPEPEPELGNKIFNFKLKFKPRVDFSRFRNGIIKTVARISRGNDHEFVDLILSTSGKHEEIKATSQAIAKIGGAKSIEKLMEICEEGPDNSLYDLALHSLGEFYTYKSVPIFKAFLESADLLSELEKFKKRRLAQYFLARIDHPDAVNLLFNTVDTLNVLSFESDSRLLGNLTLKSELVKVLKNETKLPLFYVFIVPFGKDLDIYNLILDFVEKEINKGEELFGNSSAWYFMSVLKNSDQRTIKILNKILMHKNADVRTVAIEIISEVIDYPPHRVYLSELLKYAFLDIRHRYISSSLEMCIKNLKVSSVEAQNRFLAYVLLYYVLIDSNVFNSETLLEITRLKLAELKFSYFDPLATPMPSKWIKSGSRIIKVTGIFLAVCLIIVVLGFFTLFSDMVVDIAKAQWQSTLQTWVMTQPGWTLFALLTLSFLMTGLVTVLLDWIKSLTQNK